MPVGRGRPSAIVGIRSAAVISIVCATTVVIVVGSATVVRVVGVAAGAPAVGIRARSTAIRVRARPTAVGIVAAAGTAVGVSTRSTIRCALRSRSLRVVASTWPLRRRGRVLGRSGSMGCRS